jgi:hypothetical protein
VDDELGREAFTYTLESGREGTVHVEQVLDYHRDPGYLAGCHRPGWARFCCHLSRWRSPIAPGVAYVLGYM